MVYLYWCMETYSPKVALKLEVRFKGEKRLVELNSILNEVKIILSFLSDARITSCSGLFILETIDE